MWFQCVASTRQRLKDFGPKATNQKVGGSTPLGRATSPNKTLGFMEYQEIRCGCLRVSVYQRCDDCGPKIEDVPMDETRVPRLLIDDLPTAKRILECAGTQRSDIHWMTVGSGSYGLHEKR